MEKDKEQTIEHTKGPWTVGKGYSVRGDDRIVFMQGATKTHREANANAHLIAAAPELLEACKYVVQHHREKDSGEGELFGLDFVTTCISAIAKAEGK